MHYGNAPNSPSQITDDFQIFMSNIELLLNDILRCFLKTICHKVK